MQPMLCAVPYLNTWAVKLDVERMCEAAMQASSQLAHAPYAPNASMGCQWSKGVQLAPPPTGAGQESEVEDLMALLMQ